MKLLSADVTSLRAAISDLPDVAAQESLEPPPLQRVYVPPSHQRALSLEASVVVGMRGAGKSLWTAVLANDQHRQFVASLAGSRGLGQSTVRVGFGLDDTNVHFPNADTLGSVVSAGVDPFAIWKEVVLKHSYEVLKLRDPRSNQGWLQRCRWAAEHPQEVDTALTACDQQLASNGQVLLVLFDALDRLATTWSKVRLLLSAALRFALNCRGRRALRIKLFLRPDMEEDGEVWLFPDSSKLRHSRVELSWKSSELYGLILTHLVNSEKAGPSFRSALTHQLKIKLIPQSGVFLVPRIQETELRSLVEAIAGPWMGRDKKRGLTFTWIPTHLADAAARISPRSFLLAFKRAAEWTGENMPNDPRPLTYQGIQSGVAEASRIRIEEIKEDYPWVEPLLEAARGLSVPCLPGDFRDRWTSDHLERMKNSAKKLPPRRFTTDPLRKEKTEALIDDLIELAVLYRTGDGRLNMPDIFRVGFGIMRKGGVRPLKL